jgi:hypothetical protein
VVQLTVVTNRRISAARLGSSTTQAWPSFGKHDELRGRDRYRTSANARRPAHDGAIETPFEDACDREQPVQTR